MCSLSPATVRHGLCSPVSSDHDLPAHDRQAGSLLHSGDSARLCTSRGWPYICVPAASVWRPHGRPDGHGLRYHALRRLGVARWICARDACGKSAGPPALPVLQLPRNCSAGSATAVRVAHSRPSRRLWCDRSVWPPGVRMACRDAIVRSRREAIRHAPIRAACGAVVSRVAVRGAVGRCACSRDVWPASCTDTCGMWHRRIAGSCAGRGGGREGVRSRRVAMRHAPMRGACGVVVSRGAVWGAMGGVRACDRLCPVSQAGWDAWPTAARAYGRSPTPSRAVAVAFPAGEGGGCGRGVRRCGMRRRVRHVAPAYRG